MWLVKCKHFKLNQFKSIDIEVSEKTAIKVSSTLLQLPENIVYTDIDTTKVSSIVSMSISIFDINNPAVPYRLL